MNFSRPMLFFAALMTAHPFVVKAGGTRIWELAGFSELQKGELKGVTLSSLGEISLGLAAEKTTLEEKVGVVWAAKKNADGDVYLGTGYDGKIFRVRNLQATHVADTKQLVVTALAFDNRGDLFAAALPDPVIWRIAKLGAVLKGKPVEAEKWVTLPKGTKHIWSLVFSKDGRTLYAGTGPEGKVFAIGKDKVPQVFLDTEEDHILSMAIDKKGELLIGTSPSALLLRVTGPGRSMALADFDAVEVKVVIPYQDNIYAAVNDFKTPPEVPSKTAAVTVDVGKSAVKSTKTVIGDGSIYKIDASSRLEKRWSEKKQHITSMAVSKTGKLFAGLGTEGKVISVDAERRIRYELDLEERQVMAIIAEDDLTFAGLGDAGAAYTIARARKAEAVYLTPLLDAATVSEWGRITWLAEGRLKVQSRSGNTLTPNTAWSDWSKPIAQNGLIPSLKAKYLQLRFSWEDDDKAVLTSLQTALKPSNLRAIITEFDPGSPFPKPAGSIDETTSDRVIDARPEEKTDSELNLTWKVDNPDGDDLRYRLWYRGVGEKVWRPILREDEVLVTLRYIWKTESVPEGNYQIKLVADDSIENDLREITEDTFLSPPVLVDNHQPVVKGLAFKGGTIKGTASDSFSNIGAIDYSVDNGPWFPVSCEDRVFDETEEAFSFSLPKDLSKGPHAVAVRTYDRGGNMGVAELHVTVR